MGRRSPGTGYRDRSAVLDPRHADRIVPGGNGVFHPTLVLDGKVVGTWRRDNRELELFGPLNEAQRSTVDEALERYTRFIGPKAPRSRRGRSVD